MPTKPRFTTILVVDDDPDMLKLVSNNLRSAGYHVTTVTHGMDALKHAREARPSLIILDLMLPEMSGLEVFKLLKREQATNHIPTIMLTAKADAVDRIVGLELGVDDYISKPFSPRELILRVKSILRLAPATTDNNDQVVFGDIHLHRARHEVTIAGKSVDFTSTEFKLLALLIERRGQLQSRETLLNEVWGYATGIESRTVDTHIRRLWEKLGKSGSCIQTIRGFGYRAVETER